MYLDTAIVAKLFFNEPESDRVQDLVSEHSELYSSELLVTEFYSVVARKLREGSLTKTIAKEVIDTFHRLEGGTIELIPVTGNEMKRAGQIIMKLKDEVCLRSLDAIHIAVCSSYNLFPLFTNDKVMIAAAESLGVPIQTL